MMPAIEITLPSDAPPTPLAPQIRAYAAIVVARLRAVAPYALIELVLPGGSVIALLLWFYRRRQCHPGLLGRCETVVGHFECGLT